MGLFGKKNGKKPANQKEDIIDPEIAAAQKAMVADPSIKEEMDKKCGPELPDINAGILVSDDFTL